MVVNTKLLFKSMGILCELQLLKLQFTCEYGSMIRSLVEGKHGDFKGSCAFAETADDCFAPVAEIDRRVRQIAGKLLRTKNVDVRVYDENGVEHLDGPESKVKLRVLVSSDEKDPAWWEEGRKAGWTWIDHKAEKTEELYGEWYVT